jgi:hypothetical protein
MKTPAEIAASCKATPKQLETFEMAIRLKFDKMSATIITEDDDLPSCIGMMCIETVHDGAFSHGFFDTDGNLVGHWS